MRRPPKHIKSRVDKAAECWTGTDAGGWYWWITVNPHVDDEGVSVWGDADHDSAGFVTGEDSLDLARQAIKQRLTNGRKCEWTGDWPDSAGYRHSSAPDAEVWQQLDLF